MTGDPRPQVSGQDARYQSQHQLGAAEHEAADGHGQSGRRSAEVDGGDEEHAATGARATDHGHHARVAEGDGQEWGDWGDHGRVAGGCSGRWRRGHGRRDGRRDQQSAQRAHHWQTLQSRHRISASGAPPRRRHCSS